ncbi:hypothetical protein F5888DRAFT_85301 [Russula emetica]|nr:hypothetical protein F5888DRAFT_85301 [Russula emetica]
MGTYTTGFGVLLIISSFLSRTSASGPQWIMTATGYEYILTVTSGPTGTATSVARGHSMGTGPQLVHVSHRKGAPVVTVWVALSRRLSFASC